MVRVDAVDASGAGREGSAALASVGVGDDTGDTGGTGTDEDDDDGGVVALLTVRTSRGRRATSGSKGRPTMGRTHAATGTRLAEANVRQAGNRGSSNRTGLTSREPANAGKRSVWCVAITRRRRAMMQGERNGRRTV